MAIRTGGVIAYTCSGMDKVVVWAEMEVEDVAKGG